MACACCCSIMAAGVVIPHGDKERTRDASRFVARS